MPFVFSHVEYCDMHFLYGFWNGNVRAVVEEYQTRFPDRRIDYYIWGHMKTLVYETKVESRAALHDRIFAAAEHIRNHPDKLLLLLSPCPCVPKTA